MDVSKLSRGEVMAIVGGLLLAISCVLLKWYESVSALAVIGGNRGLGSYNIFEVNALKGAILLAAALAPIILAWIIIREHKLSWPRGQLTMVISIAVLGLVIYSGIIDRPGDPSGEIKLRFGWYVAVVGGILMLVGSTIRAQESETVRKPPGVL
jgi:4-hydroxybenzoate polyprenyltransferase